MPSTGPPRAARSFYGAGQAALAQPGQVGHGGPAAGQDHQVGVGDLGGGGDEPDRHARLGRQRVGVGEVADPGQPDHRHPEHVAGRAQGRLIRPGPEAERVLRVQPQPGRPRQHAEHRPAGEVAQPVQARLQQSGVAAELVHHEPGDQRLVLGAEQGEGAVQGGQRAAPVDVGDHDHRQARRPGQAHVRDVVRAQVDLGRAARTLADDRVEPVRQPGQAGQHGARQARLEFGVGHGIRLGDRFPEHHDLAGAVAAGLEQHRVQCRLGLDARRGGLHRLGPADLRAIPGDHRVQRHVLRLERGHLDAAPGQPAADPRGDRALARLRRRPGDQDPLHGSPSRGRRHEEPVHAVAAMVAVGLWWCATDHKRMWWSCQPTTNVGCRGRAARFRQPGSPRPARPAERVRGSRAQDRGGEGDEPGQPDGAVDVGGAGRRPIAEGAAPLGQALVDVGAAEADPERTGERGLAAARVRAGMRGPVAAHGAQSPAPAPADRGGQGHGQGGGQPGGHQVCHVIEAGGGPAEAFVTHGVMADHRVERVHRPVAEQAADAGRRAPQQRRDHGVAGVLRDRLHRRAGQLGRGEPGGVAPAQRGEPAPRVCEVPGASAHGRSPPPRRPGWRRRAPPRSPRQPARRRAPAGARPAAPPPSRRRPRGRCTPRRTARRAPGWPPRGGARHGPRWRRTRRRDARGAGRRAGRRARRRAAARRRARTGAASAAAWQ